MAHGQLDELVVQIADRLHRHGLDVSVAHALRRHHVLYEVLGPWPPPTPVQATPGQIDEGATAVSEAIDALAHTPSGDPATPTLATMLERLNTLRGAGAASAGP